MRSFKGWWSRVSARLPLGPRSNGVRVRRATAPHIRVGDIARGRRDWQGAAHAYDQALASEPQLHHIWVQLGHMEKEAGRVDRATDAYREAARLRPDDAEPLLRLGHMAKAWRQPIEAAGYFVEALQRDPGNLQAIAELVRLIPDRDDVDPVLWATVLTVLEIDAAEGYAHQVVELPAGSTVFDVTDLLAFFGQRRLPTGIQRVQIEVSLACLSGAIAPPPVFCVYSSARRGWIRLPDDRFQRLCLSARQSDDVEDPVWTSQLDAIYRRIAVARTIRFPSATVLVNLGTSWSDRNYLLDVRTVRACAGVVYVPLVFDLIPLIGPQWFMDSLVHDYRAWFGSLLHSADGFLAISQATRRDLLRVSSEWNAPVPSASVPVVRLDGDFRQPAAGKDAVRAFGLEPRRYVLFVSTLEPRKNHLGAFKAWLALAETLGEEAMPRLVCVGGRGWLNEDVHRLLRESARLRRMVRVLHGVPDDVLAAFYEHCLFALYPSFYEGWGLPVSEALSYGKVPAISCVSSLPEAGGPYARYFDPCSVEDIAGTVRLLLDDATRQDVEAAIRSDYSPRTWQGIAREMLAEARTIASRSKETLPLLVDMGVRTLALGRSIEEVGVAEQGEAFRLGHAWLAPDPVGCTIDGDDASLRFHWVGLADRELHLHIAAMPDPVSVTVSIDGQCRDHHAEPGETMVVPVALPAIAAPVTIGIVPMRGGVVVERVVVAHRA